MTEQEGRVEYQIEIKNLITGERRLDMGFPFTSLEDAKWMFRTIDPEREPVIVARVANVTEWTPVRDHVAEADEIRKQVRG